MSSRTLDRSSGVEPAPGGPRARVRLSQRRWWPWARRAFALAFFAVVLTLLWRYARNVDWDDVLDSVRQTPRPALLLAVALAACIHLL